MLLLHRRGHELLVRAPVNVKEPPETLGDTVAFQACTLNEDVSFISQERLNGICVFRSLHIISATLQTVSKRSLVQDSDANRERLVTLSMHEDACKEWALLHGVLNCAYVNEFAHERLHNHVYAADKCEGTVIVEPHQISRVEVAVRVP
eukprot:XP_001709412.1 Hypothetical protein GL50803_36974 [Giardia lamblia ATCC 50803]